MTRYLVTGGAGFLGINLVRHLLASDHEVTSLDMAEFDYADCRDRIRIITGDVRSRDDVRQAIYEHYLAEIRRWDADVPVCLSTENFRMWDRMAPKLGVTATRYVCGCGPQSTPGKKVLDCHPFQVAVPDADGVPGVLWDN